MTVFWIISGVLTCVVAGILVAALVVARRRAAPAAAFDLQVYRDQLREIDRDATRGTIAPEEAERLRAEVSRRILAADATARSTPEAVANQSPMAALLSVAMIAALGLGAFGIYWRLGAPGYGDMALQARIAAADAARANRPSQAEAEAQAPAEPTADVPEEYLDLVTRLRAVSAERPDDLQGQRLLARSEAALGNYAAARAAQQQVLALLGDAATATDHADLADMMVLAAGGYVSPEAEAALENALRRDPGNGVARYYGGLMMAQTGRPDRAFRMWDQLLRESRPDAPWVPPIRAQIEEAALRAGVTNYQLPDLRPAPGPSSDDIAAAQDMTAEERAEMIQRMVARLSDRLATEGGPPEDWARLIGALGVLGDMDQARAVWQNAQEVFAGNTQALERINAAAQPLGLTP